MALSDPVLHFFEIKFPGMFSIAKIYLKPDEHYDDRPYGPKAMDYMQRWFFREKFHPTKKIPIMGILNLIGFSLKIPANPRGKIPKKS